MATHEGIEFTGKQPGATTTGGAIVSTAEGAASSLTHSGCGPRAEDVTWAAPGDASGRITEGKTS